MTSEYFKGLETSAQHRYQDKLPFEGQQLPDPLDDYVVQFTFSSGPRNFPPVTAADIFMYSVEGVCFYSKEQFKNHKLSDAYNSFLSGKVKRVMSFKAGKRGVGVCGGQPAALKNVPAVVHRQRRRHCRQRSLHVHSWVSAVCCLLKNAIYITALSSADDRP